MSHGNKPNGHLMVINVLVNGIAANALIDTGCSARVLLDHNFCERASLRQRQAKTIRNVVLGDGESKVSIDTQVNNLQIRVKNYSSSETQCGVMKLGGYDLILGLPWLKSLESKGDKAHIKWSFTDNTIKTKIKGKKVVLQGLAPEVLVAPRHSTKYLRQMCSQKDKRATELDGSKMVMVSFLNPHQPTLVKTINGDQYIPVSADKAEGTTSKDDKISEGGEREASTSLDLKIPNPDDTEEILSNTETEPKRWTPVDPSTLSNFDCTDDKVFERVEVGSNSIEELDKIHPDLKKEIKKHGKVFSDWIPINEIPDRGTANVKFKFADPTPHAAKPYRLSPAESKALGEILQDMLSKGIIRPSDSPWGAPVFLVPKATGGYRLCADYRVLNSRLVAQSYCLPAADMLFDRLRTARVFTLQDCTWGYHQLKYDPSSIPATAIRTHLGTFEFLVLNFGPSTGPAAWQRFIESVLRPFHGKFCFVFLDDLIIFSNNREEHLQHLALIWRRLYANRVFLRIAKCKFMKEKIQYLGWVVENGKLSASPEKLEVIRKWPRPDSKSEVRSFIGFCNFYRKLIKDCSKILAPLSDLTKDEVPNGGVEFNKHWGEKEQQAFDCMKDVLTSEPVIMIPNENKGYRVEIDASFIAIGAVLYQQDEHGKWRVVSFMSKRLGGAQARYDSGKLELLGLIVTLTYWKHYLMGAPSILIQTDNEALTSLRTNKNPSRMQQRWLHFIEGFRFDVEHKKGKENIPADILSRPKEGENEPSLQITEDGDEDLMDLPDISLSRIDLEDFHELEPICVKDYNAILYQNVQKESVFGKPDSLDMENQLQIDTSTIRTLTEHDETLQKSVINNPKEFIMKDGFAFRIKEGHVSLYIPIGAEDIKRKILYLGHYIPTSGHFGREKTIKRIQRYYYWPNLTVDVKETINACKICQRCKRMNIGPPHMSVHDVPDTSWWVVSMDETSTVTPSGGYDCIWIFVDKLTKMAHFVAAKKEGLTSEKLAHLFFDNVYRLHGLPHKIISDRDPRINNEFWQQLLKKAGARANMSTAGRPETDGQSEVNVRGCIDALRAFVNSNRDDWIKFLSAVEFAYNDTVHNSTGYTPFEMNYGKHPRSLTTLLFESITKEDNIQNKEAIDLWGKLIQITEQARENLQKANDKMMKNNTGTRKETFERGDKVLLDKRAAGKGFSKEKLAPLYVGPFTILRKHGEHAYLLSLPPSMDIDPVINIRNLKRYRMYENEIDDPQSGESLPNLPSLGQAVNITKMEIVIEEGIHRLYGTINQERRSILELIRRGYFEECNEKLMEDFHKLNLPSVTGRLFRKKFRGQMYEGLVTAWDPINKRAEFEIGYSDGDSEWVQNEQLRGSLQKKPPKPAILASISKKKLKILVLCSGTKSVEKALVRRFGEKIETTSVDIEEKYHPDIHTDINLWDYAEAFPVGHFDVIWASPDCSQYSIAHSTGNKDVQKADDLALKCLEIIQHFKPEIWVIENSDGELKKRSFMQPWEEFKKTCSYCCYGFPYRKNTNIWTNASVELKRCTKETPCRNVRKARFWREQGEYTSWHPAVAQHGISRNDPYQIPAPKETLYRIPHQLVEHILLSICSNILHDK